MKYIAILLTVHNRKIKTLQCLTALYEQQLVEDYMREVYLVNDGSTDGTTEVLKKHFPKVNIIEGDGTLYWNRGMYRAWQAAVQAKDYDFYLWLNDDTLLQEFAIENLISSSNKLENKAIIVGTTKAQNTNTITYGGRTKDGQIIVPNEQVMPCMYFNGNIVLIPRLVYQTVGMNDPIFHHSLGDFDYGLRARKLGILSYVAPFVLGCCDKHNHLPTWCNPEKPLIQRLKRFRNPLGQNPEEYFIYEKRHNGLFLAFTHYITNHLRVLFPNFWIKYKQKC